MICRNCGANFPDGSPACPQCGTPADMGAPVYQAPAPAAQGDGSETKIMIFGILGLALSESVIGLIFAIIALKMANAYIANFGPISGKVKTGKTLATVGLIISIVFFVIWAGCIACYACAICSAASTGALSSVKYY